MSTASTPAPPPEALPPAPAPHPFVRLGDGEPIRADLFGLEHLEAHARHLAASCRAVSPKAPGDPLLRRFHQNGRDLARIHQEIVAVSNRQESITPDAEWLLDNFHIIEETLREVRHDLPRGYYKKLPKLTAGPFARMPRVYALSVELIAHTDGSLDETNITRFVQAFQSVTPLTIGELWAVPTMLRVVLLENLRCLGSQTLHSWEERRKGEELVGRLCPQTGGASAHEVQLPPTDPDLSDPCVVRLLQALRDRGPEASPCVEWLEGVLSRRGLSPGEVLRREHQRQAANLVSVGNSVTSLRLLSNLDWSVFFETTNLVEAALRADPAGVYPRQDFATKDRYRRTVERLARRCDRGEKEVADEAVALAARSPSTQPLSPEVGERGTRMPPSPPSGGRGAGGEGGADPRRHVGYYLVGPGAPDLEAAIGYRPALGHAILRWILAHPNTVYFGSLLTVTAFILGGLIAWAAVQPGAAPWLLVLVGLAALLPATELAVGVVHYLITLVLPPRVLAKLDFKGGIPADCTTFVVMPTMLTSEDSGAVLADRLEVHYLSNPDPQLRFALLTDFADAPTETRPEDEKYLRAALERIQALNERHAAGGPERFFLFHRKRQWDAREGCWMGWERKRGKLGEFNRLLRGATDTSYVVQSGDLSRVPHVRYVITLDADTQLPRETARRMVATLAHPLNRARLDPARGRVVEGYGILQPRVSLSLVAATRSLFARVLASSAGLDPYTTAVSDVYQDLFGRGTFTGKGIYDVDAFEGSAGHAFPDNHILSHDLIEGNFARCGLVTDIELLDDFPSKYHAYAKREHRWVRGDWQILPWLFPSAPAPEGRGGRTRRPNPLPALERWKILDNLRRSLMPPALVLLLALGWTVLPGPAWGWTLLALLCLAVPLLLLLVGSAISLVRGGSWQLQMREVRASIGSTGGQALLSITFLAEQARQMLDAIVRTLYRMTVSRRHMLEWETAAAAEKRLGTGFLHFVVHTWGGPVTAVLLGVLVGVVNPGALPVAVPLLAAWFFSPLVAYWVSRPTAEAESPLTAEERRELRRMARKTWHFFETFVTAEDNWLPPDNYQESPKGQVAHRTSPTNQGLYLLSTLAAHDFGYLTSAGLAERVEHTFAAFDRLDRFRGHFYNWYDTQSLRVLEPGYVSTVDSGNLLACLLTLRQGLLAKAEARPDPGVVREGLLDTLRLAAEQFHALELPGPPPPADFQVVEARLTELNRLLGERPADLLEWDAWLARMELAGAELTAHVQSLGVALNEEPEELRRWAERLLAQLRQQREELDALAPWLKRFRGVGAAAALGTGLPPETAARWREVLGLLTQPFSLEEFAARQQALHADLTALQGLEKLRPEARALLAGLAQDVGASAAPALRERLLALADRAGAIGAVMDFRFLYNEQRNLFSIGYNRAAARLDGAHYDLLASEAALTSFLAVARGDAPKKHWFQLGRQLTRAPGGIALMSWGGTMFEYLMPRLLLPNFAGTLLDVSAKGAVDRQIEYGRHCRTPWGISESGFNALDAALDYQYQSFGVPGLGLKRGLSRDLVIAPYATMMALMVRPHAARENLRALRAERAEGPYGMYEAIDYTRDRLKEKRRSAVVRSFMAHHQGMSLVALANCLLNGPMQRRFHGEPMVRATELLLQERVPRVAPIVDLHEDEAAPAPVVREGLLPMSRRITSPHTPHPRTQVLSGGRYTVMLTNAGSGASTSGDLDVTRWREDRTCDSWGQWVYVHDRRTGELWSAGYQPVCREADSYEVTFSTDKAEFRRRDGHIETHLEVTVSPENAAEIRRLTLTNSDSRPHELDLTSYAEVVLLNHRADLAHPAFGKLFLETEFVPEADALLCRRRPRSADQKPVWCVHVLAVDGPTVGEVQWETDRARFLGRGRTTARPAALEPGAALSGTTGPVLDPVLSLRRRVRVAPGASVSVAFTTAVAKSREEALALADHYHDFHGVHRAFELAWAHTQVQLRHLHLSAEEAHLFQRLAAFVLYAGPTLRAPASVLNANRQGQQGLWRHGISGDKPIVLARVSEADDRALVRQLLLAHAYWRLQGLEVDLVLLNEHASGYVEELQQELLAMVRASDSHGLIDKPGGIFVRKADHLADEDKVLLQSAARVVLAGNRGSLAAQVDRHERRQALPGRLRPAESRRDSEPPRPAPAPRTDLLFANGVGGFTPEGREYVLTLTQAPPGNGTDRMAAWRRARAAAPAVALPPAPWSNVIANPRFGFFVTEGGGGYTWAANSQMNRLTPWSNDPVSDPPGEVVYLRDEASGELWTPTPLPLGSAPACTVRHGQGYTVFEQDSHGLRQELLLFVPAADPVKVLRLRVRNTGPWPRQLSATFFAEWVLGTVRDQAPMQVLTEVDLDTEALLARNPYNSDFGGLVAFADVSLRPHTLTADRTEFLGRNGALTSPAALGRVGLSGRVGPGLDPCAALMAPFELEPGQEQEVIFLLGEGNNLEEVRRLLAEYRDGAKVQAAFEDVCRRWDDLLGAVQVRTPDRGMDLLLNRWLLYQVLSCRVWGRSAFYQSGGAYGFRDQLQDVMALAYAAPAETRAQLLRAAARQFLEGDVQHWWHPPVGRGVRTRFSDDFLWLAFVAAHYVSATGDYAVLDEPVRWLRAPLLRPEQEEEYVLPEVTEESAPLYEHCVRAVENGFRYGAHGLPLMGIGDWNDGMNRVGAGGKGESVWDAWFQLTILPRFAEIAERRGDVGRAARYRAEAERLRKAVEEQAWDGAWYRRAYFDDGTPLGSAQNDECQIDSLPQTWAVISGAGDPARAKEGMRAVRERLVRPTDGLILLFTPPFDQGPLQPGYIKGYVPGIRENGGQYTHAATWVALAEALLGEGDRAAELWDLISPVSHTSSPEGVARYKVEPYVVAADVYGVPPHTGRGGWTWYTGSASWLYRVALESILGFHLHGDRLRVEPVIPSRWPGFEITYRRGAAAYHVTVENPKAVEHGVASVTLDGADLPDGTVPLADDGRTHEVRVVLG